MKPATLLLSTPATRGLRVGAEFSDAAKTKLKLDENITLSVAGRLAASGLRR